MPAPRTLSTLLGCALLIADGAHAGEAAAPMQLGPVLNEAMRFVPGAKKSGKGATDAPADTAIRGITVDLGGAAICYDADLMRPAGAWTGGFIGWKKVYKDRWLAPAEGAQGVFATPALLGAAAQGATLADPRPKPWGPAPASAVKYRGRYLHGKQVVLSYTVGETQVLESPALIDGAIVRRLTVAPGAALTLMVAGGVQQASGAGTWSTAGGGIVAAVAPAGGATLRLEKDLLVLDVPKAAAPLHLSLAIASGGGAAGVAKAVAAAPEDLARLTRGGPGRWGKPLETAGKPGTDEGAFAVDAITAPMQNPWNSPMRFTGLDFFADGRAALCTWDGDVVVVSGIDATLAKLGWQRFATGLYMPCGLKIVKDQVYVACKDGIARLADLDGDGEADWYENFSGEHAIAYSGHQWAMNLETDKAGNFYYTMGGHRGVNDGLGHACTTLRVDRDGRNLEVFAGGYREVNGMSIGPDDTVIGADNPGGPGETPIDILRRGGTYGYLRDFAKTPPLLWLPRKVDRSAGSQAWVPASGWGPIPTGGFIHSSYGNCTIFAVSMDRGGAVPQGLAWRFPTARFTFASGAFRPRFHPKDGQLYIAGLRGWDTNGATEGCFDRVRATGRPGCLPVGYTVTKTGLRLALSSPADASVGDSANWTLQSVPQTRKDDRKGPLAAKVALSADRRTLDIAIDGFAPLECIELIAKVKDGGADATWEMWATVNAIP